MNLSDIGITSEIAKYLVDKNLGDYTLGRVIRENRERYVVSTGENDYEAEITGNMMFTANSRADYPSVGDWVIMKTYNYDLAIIHEILPRRTVLERQSINKPGEKQIIAANVDIAFIVQSIDNNLNINRLERYLTICHSAGIEPVFVISKIDLSSEKEIKEVISILKTREKDTRYILLSNITKEGLDQIMSFIEKGKTYCVVGSSGVGKSTLINNILKKDILKTREISKSTNKGKHTTDHRELFILENGGIIIDTPGMRELGITDDSDGINTTFNDIFNLSLKCKFPDCKHLMEEGCAVVEALEKGLIDRDSLENYRKMNREQEHFQLTLAEKRKKERQFGKMVKKVMNEKNKYKY